MKWGNNKRILKLSDTAALVMSWSMPLYKQGLARSYIDCLDLSAGDALLMSCNEVCPWYDKVILDRKHFVRCLVENVLRSSNEGPWQIVIPAAGVSPLSLELLAGNSTNIASIFEIDLSEMEEKNALYRSIAPALHVKVRHITGDITAPTFIEVLKNVGYRSELPTIVLLEGISYYISREDLRRLISIFRSEQQQNKIIIEYLLPCSSISEERWEIPKGVFGTIKDHAGLQHIRCYTADNIEVLLKGVGGNTLVHYSQADMERARTGTQIRFQRIRDGWIGCSVASL
jgi:O-methyltransferase involved in polyketide biosynthesis